MSVSYLFQEDCYFHIY